MSFWQKVADVAASAADGLTLTRLLRRGVDPAAANSAESAGVWFTIALVALCAKMARADGVVTTDEVDMFRRVVRVEEEDEPNVRRLFNLAKQDTAGFEDYARQIGIGLTIDPRMRRDVFESLYAIAAADGVLHMKEDRFLAIVAEHMLITASESQHIRALFVRGEQSPYAILGLTPESSDAEIKARHRSLVRESHPDRLAGLGLPPELVALGERKLATINAAFDAIAEERGL